MTIRLHPQARSRLVALLADGIANLKVTHGSFLEFESVIHLIEIDDVLPRKHAEIGLVGSISEQPALHFVTETIEQHLREREWSNDPAPEPLSTIPGYEDTTVAAEKLVEQFETLPWEYRLFAETPFGAEYRDILGESMILGPRLRLFLPDEHHARTYALPDAKPF